jgi:hypothetical protein
MRGPAALPRVALPDWAGALRESASRHNRHETEPENCLHDPPLLKDNGTPNFRRQTGLGRGVKWKQRELQNDYTAAI